MADLILGILTAFTINVFIFLYVIFIAWAVHFVYIMLPTEAQGHVSALIRAVFKPHNEVKAEAIKEFAEKLKAEHSTPDILMPFNWISIEDTALDELVTEMAAAEPDPEGQNQAE